MTTGKTIALTRQTFVGKVMSLLFNMLSSLVITFLPRSKRLLISWLHRLCSVIKNMECLPQLKWCTEDLDLICTDDFHFRFLSENVLHSVIQKHCWKKGDTVLIFSHCLCFWFMDTPKICIWTRPSENCKLRSNWYKCFFWSPKPLALRVGHDWATSLSIFTFMHWRRQWQPTPVFLPGESQGWGSLVGCCLWGRAESDTTEVT